MLAYAVNARPAARTASPRALVLILAGHAVLIGTVMSAKMGVIDVDPFNRTEVTNIPIEPPPPPEPPKPQVEPRPDPQNSFIQIPPREVVMGPTTPTLPLDQGPPQPAVTPVIGSSLLPIDPPRHLPVRIAAVFKTPDSQLRPPYPLSKIRNEEEATLKLRLSIDARGRVTAVEPVGSADPEFLAAARRHIVRAWRYKPATEDGVAVPSSTVISLSFRLEDA